MSRIRFLGLVTLLILGAGPAQAHIGIGSTSGLVNGFAHPFGGADHVLAMLAVGIFAAQLGGRALWIVPTTFVSVMAAAAASGAYFGGLPFMEIGITGSVALLGIVVAYGRNIPVGVAATLVGFLAIFHGQAHGSEMTNSSAGFEFAIGFILATALLHAIGVALRFAIVRPRAEIGHLITRIGGAMIAIAGLSMASF